VARAIRTSHREDGLLAVSITASEELLSPSRAERMRQTLLEITDRLQMRL
jgi:hypothetical protein